MINKKWLQEQIEGEGSSMLAVSLHDTPILLVSKHLSEGVYQKSKIKQDGV